MERQLLRKTFNKAQKILKDNTYTLRLNGTTYRRIVPSKEFYVHQWNWDSATHAMGLVHIDEELAFDEIRSLLSGQWENGLVAQITFNPNEKKYFPGSQFWGTEQFKRGEIITSGITQPPLLAVSIEHTYRNAKNQKKAKAFLLEVLPKLIAYHEYLQNYRDPEKSGLLTIIHPWESGTDNSPRFDQSLEQIHLETIPQHVKDVVDTYRTDDKEGQATHRPRLYDYYRYMHLIALFKDWKWDYVRIVKESPFAVKDILFSSIWAKANQSLGSLLRESGDHVKAKKFEDLSEKTIQALHQSWNTKVNLYTDTNVARGKNIPILEDTIASLMPLYAGWMPVEQFKIIFDKLTDPNYYYAPFPIPSTSLANPKFDLARYWRGPSWPITNLFLYEGLQRRQKEKKVALYRQELLEKTLTIISRRGFYEYYDPLLGVGEIEDQTISLGFGSFSWTAAIFIYLHANYNSTI